MIFYMFLCKRLPEGRPPFSYGFPMVFPLKSPFSYGVPMIFPFSYGFPMIFPGYCISTNGLKTRGRQRGKDVAAPDDAVAAHVQETEGDAQAALGAGGDLWKVENPMM
jgi:hypothetical protein